MILDPFQLALASVVLLLAAVLWFRLPIALIMACLGFVGMGLLSGFDAARSMLGTELWGSFSSYGLTVIPLFILMGQISFYSGLNERLYRALFTLVGHVPGGLAVATLLACAGFSAICGSNTATAATMAGAAMPEMKKYGYDRAFSAGTVAVGATLGVVIPPSVVLILIGLQAGLSISKLFLAGIIPGICLTIAFTLCAYVCGRVRPAWAPTRPKASFAARLGVLPLFSEIILLWGGVLGGMSYGIVTPTEAGALGSVLALALGLARRTLSLKALFMALKDTLRLSAMILLLVAGALIYGKFLAASRLPGELAAFVSTSNLPPTLMLVVLVLVYTIGGMIMDALALLLITVPIFFPLMDVLGYDPLWFAMLTTILVTLGAVTPPVGVCAYVVAALTPDVTLPGIFRGIACYIPAYALVLVLMVLMPALVLWLPGLV